MAASPGKETIGAHANCASELNTSMAELFLFPDGVIVCVYINLGNEGFPIGVSPFNALCFFESEEKDATHSVKHITRVPLAGQPRHTRVFIFSYKRTHFIRAVHIKAVPSLSLPSMARDSVGSPYKQQPLSSASFAPLLHLPLLLSRASRSRDEPCLLVFFFEFFRLRFCFGR